MRRMTGRDGGQVFKADRYQVLLLSCPATLPFSFASHPWFVVNKKGTISRWEVFMRPQEGWSMRWGHLHKDFYPPFRGIALLLFSEKYTWKRGVVRGVIEGAEGSLAHHIAECIEASWGRYPYRNDYALMGPNSNTYAQWILDQFPECGLRLRWNAWGKRYAALSEARHGH